jgi:hypothetical protein
MAVCSVEANFQRVSHVCVCTRARVHRGVCVGVDFPYAERATNLNLTSKP